MLADFAPPQDGIASDASTCRRPRRELILPDTAKEKPQEGEVLAVGKGKIVEVATSFPGSKGR